MPPPQSRELERYNVMTVAETEVGAISQQPTHPRRRIGDKAIQNLFIWPTLILLILWNIFPLCYSLYLSFTEYSVIAKIPPVWIGFQNYVELLHNEQVWSYFAVTGRFALASVGLQALIGFGLARNVAIDETSVGLQRLA